MARLPPDLSSGSDPDSESLEEIEDASLIAQQAAAHLPSRRAQISEESRSVVIAEPAPSTVARPRPQRRAGDATLVIRDRRQLDKVFGKIAAQRRQQSRRAWLSYAWAALAVLAFAVGGALALFLLRGHVTPVPEIDAAASVELPPSDRGRPPASAAGMPSVVPPLVRFEELPLEAPPAPR